MDPVLRVEKEASALFTQETAQLRRMLHSLDFWLCGVE